jgi:hypothetical protein
MMVSSISMRPRHSNVQNAHTCLNDVWTAL